MFLKKIEYSEFQNDKRYWALKFFEIGKINLFVARNATGKTRTLKAIDMLRTLILGKGFTTHAGYKVGFVDKSDILQYTLDIDGAIKFENLIVNGQERIRRKDNGIGEMYAAELDKNMKFRFPEDSLAVTRRDMYQYPYLEFLFKWADGVQYYSFSTSMKQEYGKDIENRNSILNGNSDNAVEVFVVGNLEFDEKYKNRVLSSMREIGYDLLEIDVRKNLYSTLHTGLNEHKIIVKERDRNGELVQLEMSQGMFRALSIIIHVVFHAMMQTPVTILIDDIGEGLDFDRSTKLIKLLIDLAEKNDNIQLIMSTNDRFVMNAVPLEYWQVIQRKGGECHVFNCRNRKEKFEEFEYTGLNNFDFLRTDFLNSNWEPV